MTLELTPERIAVLRRGLVLVRLELVAALGDGRGGNAALAVAARAQRADIDELEAALKAPGHHHASWHNPEGNDGDVSQLR